MHRSIPRVAPMATAIRTAMTDGSALYRLLSWLSPSYPIGAFSYSHGLEAAIEEGFVADVPTLIAWLTDIVEEGAGRNDALLLRAAYEAIMAGDDEALIEAAELAAAFQPSAELLLETTTQGRAFLDTTLAAWPTAALDRLKHVEPARLALPVAVGAAAAGHGVGLGEMLHGYMHAFAANLVSAGVRLVPLGQTDGQRVIADLETLIARTVVGIMAHEKPLDHLASNSFLNDWCSMRHETQYTRLFRS